MLSEYPYSKQVLALLIASSQCGEKWHDSYKLNSEDWAELLRELGKEGWVLRKGPIPVDYYED